MLAGIRAVNLRQLTATALAGWTAGIEVRTVDLIAIGKAANEMARGAGDALGRALRSGIVIAPERADDLPDGLSAFVGGHPMPNAEGVLGARAVTGLLHVADRGRRILVLISGGASALMTLPPDGIALEEIIETSRALMEAGADIGELNSVRKHLDQLKGGQLARVAAAPVRALVLSDVIGDPLDVDSDRVRSFPTRRHMAMRSRFCGGAACGRQHRLRCVSTSRQVRAANTPKRRRPAIRASHAWMSR